MADALLVASIVLLFNTLSSESVFLDPKAKKDVKKYVSDEGRKKEILDLMSQYKEAFTVRRSIEKQMERKFEELYSVRGTSMQAFQSVISVHSRTSAEKQDLYVDSMLKLKSLVTDKEWDQLLFNIDKSAEAYLNNLDKTIKKYKKLNTEISTGLEGVIENQESREKAVAIMSEADSIEMRILNDLRVFTHKDWQLLRDRNATEEAYGEALGEYNDLWQDYIDLYLDSYSRLSNVTTDKEWKVIKKYSKQIF